MDAQFKDFQKENIFVPQKLNVLDHAKYEQIFNLGLHNRNTKKKNVTILWQCFVNIEQKDRTFSQV